VWLRTPRHRWFSEGSLKALRPYRRIIALLFIVLLVNSAAYWFTYTWMPSYLRIARKLTPQAAGNLMVWMQTGALAGYTAFGALADRFGRRPVFSVLCFDDGVGITAGHAFLELVGRDARTNPRGAQSSPASAPVSGREPAR